MVNEIIVAGPISGTPYRFRIEGTRPTVDEQRNIDAYLSAQEQAFQQQYAQTMGRPLETGEGSGIANQVGEFFKGIPRGIVGMLESGALGAAAALPENLELPVREGIRRAGYAASRPFAPDIGLEESRFGQFGQGLGSFAGLLGTAAISPLGAAGLAVGAGAGEASERARAGDATPEERAQATLLGGVVGASEMVPISLIRVLGRGTVGSLANRIARAGAEGGVEGAQEAAAQIAQNLIEQGIYNPERGTFEGAGESAIIGGGVGALVQGLLDLALPRTRGAADITPDTTVPVPEDFLSTLGAEQRAPMRPGQDEWFQPREQAPEVRAAMRDLFPEPELPLRGGAAAAEQRELSEVPPPSPRQLSMDLQQAEVQGELPLVAPRGTQMDLFREGPPVPPQPAASEPATPPAEPAAPSLAVTPADLDTLNVGRGAAVYQGVKSGALQGDAALDALLTYARRIERNRADDAARVRNFVEAQRDVQPRPEETEQQLARIPDADVADQRGAGARPEDGGRGAVEQSGPVVDQPAAGAAEAQPGGLGDRDGNLGEAVSGAAAQQPALTPQDGQAPVATLTAADALRVRRKLALRYTDMVDDLRPSAGERELAEQISRLHAEFEQRNAVRPDQGGMPYLRKPMRNWTALDFSYAKKDMPQEAEFLSRVMDLQNEKFQRYEARRIDSTRFLQDQLREVLPEEFDARIESDPLSLIDSAFADKEIPDIDPVFRPQQGATPASPASPVPDTRAGAIPGQATRPDAPRGPIPAGIPPAPTRPAQPQRELDPAMGEAMAATVRQERTYADIEAQQAINDWFFENSSPELQAAAREVTDPTAPDPVQVRDKEAVLSLLNRPFTAREQRRNNSAWGAFRYFNRNPRVNEVLDDIAFDFAEAQVDGTTYASGDGPYYAGKGGDYARGASEWVEANLSDAAVSYMDERIAHYMTQIDGAAIDAAIEERDASIVKAQEAAKWMADNYGPNSKPRFQAALGHPLSPKLRRDLEAGDLASAMQGLAAQVRLPRLKKLAERLAPAAQGTAVRVVSETEMQRLREQYYGEAGPGFAGLYVSNGGIRTVYLNREGGMDVHTLMHEMVHAATWQAMQNRSGPTYRQLEQLARKLRAAGLNPTATANADELLAEGLSNEAFRRELAQVNLDGTKETALQRFTRAVVNAVRRIMGMPSRSAAALDLVDQQFELILRTYPTQETGRYLSSPYMAPRARGDLMNGPKGRIGEFTSEAANRIDRALGRTDIPYRAKRLLLRGAVPLRNLVDLAKPFFPNAEKVYKLVEQHGAEVHAGNQRIKNSVDEIAKYLKDNPDKVDTFNDMRLLASLYQIDPRKPENVYRRFRMYHDILDSNGRFLRRVTTDYATREERNAARKKFNAARPKDRTRARNLPDPKPEDIDVYRKLSGMYRELGPEGQRAYAMALGVFENLHRRTSEVIRARLEQLFPGQRDTQERIFGDIYRKVFADNLIVPYQPLQRRGNLWLTYRVLEGDGDAEGVEYKESFENETERNAAIQELERIRDEDGVQIDNIQPYNSRGARNQRQTVPLQFAADVLTTVERAMQGSGMDAEAQANLQQQITDLIFDASPERSYIQTYRARRNVRGFLGDPGVRGERLSRQDTVQLLTDKAFSINRQLVDMEYGPRLQGEFREIESALENIRGSGRSPQDAARLEAKAQVYADVLTEYGDAITNTRSQVSRTVTSATYGLTLGLNVSTAALTFAQFPTIIVPFLSGKYGLRSTARALGNASRVLTGSGRTRVEEFINERGEVEQRVGETGRFDYSLTNYDFDDPRNAALGHYRELADEMKARGMANRSITEDILDFDNPDNLFQKVVSFSGIMQHHAERYTRETTAIAAYDLELRRIAAETGTKRISDLSAEQRRQAADAAIYQTEMTNGTILAAGAPLMAQGNIGAIIYLYKRFGLHMYNLLANTTLRSLPRNADAADRRIARMQLGGILGAVALFSGAQGIPGYQMLAQLFDLFFTDDDEEDFETLTRLGIGELGYKGILDYATGMSISGRIGLSGMFYREPFNAENQPWWASQVEAVGGPAVGLFIKYTDRVPALLQQGDFYRATEAMLPSAIANPLRALRYSSEGVETLRGDPILGDVSPLSAAAQFMGFAPAEYIRQLEQNRVYTRIDRAIGSERTDLLRRRYVAFRQGDRDEYRRIMRDIREFNRRHPQAAISSDTLQSSLRSHLETTSDMHHGVLFSTPNRAMLQRMAERWDAPSVWAQ